MRLGVGCMVAEGDCVAAFEGVEVDDGLRVGADELLRVCVWLRVTLEDGVGVRVPLRLGVMVAVALRIGVGEAVADMLRVGVGDLLLVIVAVPEVDCDGETAAMDMTNDIRISSAQTRRLTRAIPITRNSTGGTR